MKTIATINTFEPDATSTGYTIDIRDNGTMRITSRSCWQNSRTDEVWIVDTPPEIAAALTPGEDEPDLETAIKTWLQEPDPKGWSQIRSGHIVR